MLTYITYLENYGIGQSKTKFLNLPNIIDGTIVSIFEAWKKTKIKYDLLQSHLIGFVTNGATCIIGMC